MITQKALQRASLAGLSLLSATTVYGHEPEDELELTIVSATRLSSDPEDTTSDVERIDREEIERSQRYLLRDVLDSQPGVFSFSSAGQEGTTGSLAINGLATAFNSVSIDGVQLSGTSFTLGNFLANTNTFGYSSVEILKGGQATNFGNSAAGGVVYLQNDFGDGEFGLRLHGEVGSFGSVLSEISTTGSLGDLRYHIGVARRFTENDRNSVEPEQDFENETFFGNFAYRIHDEAELKVSIRTQNSELDVDPNAANSFGSEEFDTDAVQLTGSLEFAVNPFWDVKINAGRVEEEFFNTSSGFSGDFSALSRITTVGFDTSYDITDDGTLFLGGQYSDFDRRTSSGGFSQSAAFRENSIYANYQHYISDHIFLEGGVRYEDNTAFTDDTGFHLGAKAQLNSFVSARVRYSDTFVTPTPLQTESFVTAFGTQLASPDLNPSTLKSWEGGLDIDFSDDHKLELSGYYHRLDDAITTNFDFDPVTLASTSQNVNVSGVSEVAGFSTAFRGNFFEGRLGYSVIWDYLLKTDLPQSFPRNQVKLDVFYQTDQWTLGAGMRSQSTGRFAGETDSHFVARIYGDYKVNEYLTLNTRIENLFDEDFVLADFGTAIPGAGTAFFFGATLEF